MKLTETKLRQIIQEEIRRMNEAAARRELKNLRDWLSDINDITEGGMDDKMKQKVADRLEVQLDDDVFVEPIESRTLQNILQNPDLDMKKLGNGMVLLLIGPDNPGLQGWEKIVGIGKNSGRPFWLLYSKENAK